MSFSIKPSHEYLKKSQPSTTDQKTFIVNTTDITETYTESTERKHVVKAKNTGGKNGLVISTSHANMADFY